MAATIERRGWNRASRMPSYLLAWMIDGPEELETGTIWNSGNQERNVGFMSS